MLGCAVIEVKTAMRQVGGRIAPQRPEADEAVQMSRMRRITVATAVLLALFVAWSAGGAQAPGPRRVVAIGDIHADIDAMRSALRTAGAIDARDEWIGGAL